MKKNLSKKQEYHQNHLIVHTDSLFIYRKSKDAVLDLRKITKRHKNAQDIAERELHNDNLWIDITGYEKVKKSLYPTENSEVLLKRLIEISTDPGDIIADFFSGSGTTLAVSEKLKRKWIGIDIGLMSINETKRRILNLPNFQPFEISRVVDKKRSYNIDSSVPEFFLGIGGKKRLEIDKNGLGVTIELQRDYSGITLYIVHFSSQKIENFQPLTTFRYYIDTWVLDWSYNGFQIRSTWFSTRKTKGKRLIKPVETFCRFEVFNRTKIDLALLITDIFGLELNYKFKIILLKH